MEIVKFKRVENGITCTSYGTRIGDLVVATSSITRSGKRVYKIYNLLNGKEFIPVEFLSLTEAEKLAGYLYETYRDYLFLLHEYEGEMVINMTQLTVKDGQGIKHMMDEYRNKPVIFDEAMKVICETEKQIRMENEANVYFR